MSMGPSTTRRKLLLRRYVRRELGVRAGFRIAGFLVGLTTSFVRFAEVLLLLVDHLTATIYPIAGLLTRFLRPIHHVIATFACFGPDGFPGFLARCWCVQNAHYSSQSQSRQEPR